jgi:hypothetical protein
MLKTTLRRMSRVAIAAVALVAVTPIGALAEDLPADLQAKIEAYKTKLAQWASSPVVVAAVKASNQNGGLAPGMGNAKWDELSDSDPLVQGTKTSDAGKLLSDWAKDSGISKLYLRDKDGNIVAGDSKPFFYNNGKKPVFANAIKGQPWSGGEVKPDPTTQVKGVHLSVPVLDGSTPIGVLHTSVVAP